MCETFIKFVIRGNSFNKIALIGTRTTNRCYYFNDMIGIYLIKNKTNGTVYVGQSIDIDKRWDDHIRCLNKNEHCNRLLQNDWNKFGKSAFEFSIIKECSKDKLDDLEKNYIYKYKKFGKVYNIISGGQGNRFGNKKILKRPAGYSPYKSKSVYYNCGKKSIFSELNEICKQCKNSCKQSSKVGIVACPLYEEIQFSNSTDYEVK